MRQNGISLIILSFFIVKNKEERLVYCLYVPHAASGKSPREIMLSVIICIIIIRHVRQIQEDKKRLWFVMRIKDTNAEMTPLEAFYLTFSTHVVNGVTKPHFFLSPTTIDNNIQKQWTMWKIVVHVQCATGQFNYLTADCFAMKFEQIKNVLKASNGQ